MGTADISGDDNLEGSVTEGGAQLSAVISEGASLAATQAAVSISGTIGSSDDLAAAVESVAVITAATSESTSLSATTADDFDQMNVIFIIIDEPGAEKVSKSGLHPTGDYAHLPRMFDGPNPFFDQGVYFPNAYASPLCGPFRAAAITGRHAFRTGFGPNVIPPTLNYPLPDTEFTLPEILRASGVNNGGKNPKLWAFGKWHISLEPDFMHPGVNATTGGLRFTRWLGHVPNLGDTPGENYFVWNKRIVIGGVDQGVVSYGGPIDDTTYEPSVLRGDIVAHINGFNAPFFVWWAPNAPHQPHQIPPHNLLSAGTTAGDRFSSRALLPAGTTSSAWIAILGLNDGNDADGRLRREVKRQVFDAQFEAVDFEIGRLYDQMDPDKRSKTVFVIMGDNGSPANVIDERYFDNDDVKGTLTERGMNVPLLIFSGGGYISAPGRVNTSVVANTDILRTVIDVMNGDLEAGTSILGDGARAVDGESLKPILKSNTATLAKANDLIEILAPGSQTPADWDIATRAMFDGVQYKYIRRYVKGGSPSIVEEFYDFVTNPHTPPVTPYATVSETTLDIFSSMDATQTAAYNTLKAAMQARTGGTYF